MGECAGGAGSPEMRLQARNRPPEPTATAARSSRRLSLTLGVTPGVTPDRTRGWALGLPSDIGSSPDLPAVSPAIGPKRSHAAVPTPWRHAGGWFSPRLHLMSRPAQDAGGDRVVPCVAQQRTT